MAKGIGLINIWRSYRRLKGNTRISVLFEPLWSIPYSLYTFYLGLYMKGRGITDEQIGYLISIGFIVGILSSAFSGAITDALGRKRTTLIFDLVSWPLAITLYLISGNFWMFALAQAVNGLVKIVSVSWNLMLVEDAGPKQQVAAYNWINIFVIGAGLFTPLAGMAVKRYGVIGGEQILLGFTVICMTIMILVRNHCYRETRVGQQILDDHKTQVRRKTTTDEPSFWKTLRSQPLIGPALLLTILFNAYLPIGTYSSLYYAPYLTDVLRLDKAAIAFLGGINAVVLVLVFLFLVPLFTRWNRSRLMIVGLGVQMIALLLMILIPPGSFAAAVAVIILFAIGYGIAKSFIDSVLAGVTGGRGRAGIYAINNFGISVCGAVFGFGSGYLYRFNPAAIYLLSIGILTMCIGCLVWLEKWKGRIRREENRYKCKECVADLSC